MAKVKISISIDEELLGRLDQIAEQRGDTRSYVIDKVLREGIEAQERFLEDLENPLVRGFARVLASSPRALEHLLESAGNPVDAGEAARIVEKLSEQAARGKQRQKSKRGGKRGGG